MLETVDVGERSLAAYRGVAPDAILDELARCARDLRGARILHINATPYGGGVSELLRSVVPLLNDLGLIADWKIISGDDAFFQVTKTMHNGLQGGTQGLSAAQQATYLANAEHNARLLEENYDFIFIHDPQPAAILPLHGKGTSRWVWRCHIDTAQPNPEIWNFLRGYLSEYDAAVFTMAEFAPPDLPITRVELIPPAIDPLSPKNLLLAESTARQVLDWIGVRLTRPLITQVSRFDPWKDPLGVIAAYKLVKQEIPQVQLALVGSMALDDPEGWEVYRRIEAESATDPLIHIFTNLTGVGNIEVNAFQRLSDVIVQKSIREGFGLVVSEALWKGTPVVAGRAGGIPLQMADDVGGMLVDSVEECAAALVRLLQDPQHAKALGERGQERVREHFLLPRLLLNELSLLLDLARARPIQRGPVSASARRDLVCGMALSESSHVFTATFKGREYMFCSEGCRTRFVATPTRYVAS
ncbi:MAG: glycosyltransferase [Candidatus Binatia bacterium]